MVAKTCTKVRKMEGKVWYRFDFAYSKTSLKINEEFFKKDGYCTKIVKCPNPDGYGLYVSPDNRKHQSEHAVARLKSVMGY
jgi:hypothetical protein